MQMKRSVPVAVRITLGVLGTAVALSAVLIGATMTLLRTSWGSERLRRQIVARVNDQIQGRVDIGRLSFGGDRIGLWQVALRDPDGRVVADVARVEVAVSIPRLLHKEVRITTVAIETPRLALLTDAQGSSNLARATAPRKAKPPRAPDKPKAKTNEEGWVIDLGSFSLTGGDVRIAVKRASAGDGERGHESVRVHLAALHAFIRARYATGNGALDVSFGLDGESRAAPAGPLRLSGDARVRGDQYHGRVDGVVLGGTVRAIGTVDRAHLEKAGALQALGAGSLPARAGSGQVDLWFGGRFAGALPEAAAKGSARVGAAIDHLRVADNVIDGIKVAGRVAHLSSAPGHAALTVDVASIQAGATVLRGIRLSAGIDEQTLSSELSIASPHAVGLALTGNLDPRGQALALERFALTYPGAEWTSDGIARVGFGGGRVSLTGFRLRALKQTIAIDAAKTTAKSGQEDEIDARVSLHGVRLDRLSAFLVDPKLHLGGLMDADVKADGAIANPSVELTVTGTGLKVGRPAAAAPAVPEGAVAPPTAVDLGRARLHVTCVDRKVRGDLAFKSAHGGALDVDAAVSLPRTMGGPAFKELPVRGKVVARDFDVAWLAGFNDRVESLGGRVSADARLAGTVGDPRFVGDVRWKNGAIVARGGNVATRGAHEAHEADARVSATAQP